MINRLFILLASHWQRGLKLAAGLNPASMLSYSKLRAFVFVGLKPEGFVVE